MFHGEVDDVTKAGLNVLRERIRRENIPSSSLDETINIATWNIREFGKKPRRKESIHYIAEILYQFDLVAITELRENLEDLGRVLEILGPYWKVVFSDYTPDRAGNRERLAFLFDERAVRFTGLAAEADTPRKKVNGEYVTEIDWWRSPFIGSFRSGNFDFVLIAAHIRWGSGESARLEPLKQLAKWVDDRRKSKHNVDDDIILLGDFNIPSFDSDLYKAISSRGLTAPSVILSEEHGTNLSKRNRYDQILHYPIDDDFVNAGGVLDFYCDDHKPLFEGSDMTKKQFTYELSDHLPLWVQINVDSEIGSTKQKLKMNWF